MYTHGQQQHHTEAELAAFAMLGQEQHWSPSPRNANQPGLNNPFTPQPPQNSYTSLPHIDSDPFIEANKHNMHEDYRVQPPFIIQLTNLICCILRMHQFGLLCHRNLSYKLVLIFQFHQRNTNKISRTHTSLETRSPFFIRNTKREHHHTLNILPRRD